MQPVWFFHVLSLLLLLQPSCFADASAGIARTITVDLQGQGDFKTVQEAVNSVPNQNGNWIKILVKKGVYREKISIPSEKGYILLQGEGHQATSISWNGYGNVGLDIDINGSAVFPYSSTFDSATFIVSADNFVARDISFQNTYSYDATYKADPVKRTSPAVAALVGGDKNAFYNCAFYSYQDTLCDFTGRHYFRKCLVEGAVDFIFGNGQSIYQSCVIQSVMAPGSQPGWVTAHARQNANSPGGLVFKECDVHCTGGQVYLGRAWNQHATVVFYRTSMSDVVVPQGWDAWNSGDNLDSITFAESGCTGAGADASGRVPWMKRRSVEQIATFVNITFIDGEGWLDAQP